MCGRYSLGVNGEDLYEALEERLPRMFDAGRPRWERPQDFRPNYNVAPRSRAPVIRRNDENGGAMIETMQWGLIPHWTKHPPSGMLNTINARSESLIDASSGGMWHALKGYKRCIVPAQGYYEWLKKPSSKTPHFTRLPLSSPSSPNTSPPLIFFAGLWDSVTYLSPVESKFRASENSEAEPYPTGNPLPLSTFTILTTTPHKDIRWLHDRMPCVLEGWEEMQAWMDLGEMKGWKEGKGGTAELLRSKGGLDCYPVPPEVGRIGTNSITFIQPVSERSDGIKSFFQKQAISSSPGKKDLTTPAKSVEDEGVTSPAEEDKLRAESEKPPVDAIETKIEGEEQEGLGDDSNAPNPETTSTPKKRKIEQVEGEEEEADEKLVKKGGHQTKVVRRPDDEGNKSQPAITSFFKSPSTKPEVKEEKPPGRGGRRGKK